MKSWQYKNNVHSTSYEDHNLGAIETLDTDSISICKQLAKHDKLSQEIFVMRQLGYSYKEMAEKKGFDSLHKVRNKYIEIEQSLC